MNSINNMTTEEFNKAYPEETCPKHGTFRALCFLCESDNETFIARQELNQAWKDEVNRK